MEMKKIWYESNVKAAEKHITELENLLGRLRLRKKIKYAYAGATHYIYPEEKYIKKDLESTKERLSKYQEKLVKVI